MRDVAIVSFARLPPAPALPDHSEVELVAPVVTGALDAVGLERRELGFVCSGSCDYLVGRPFSFVTAVDGLGAWPPMRESHVEMDGAWALYEAWVRLQHEDLDTALVYCFGKSSAGDLTQVMAQQLDPYYLAPLGVDPVDLAGLQAQAMVDAGLVDDAAVGPPPSADGAAAVLLATGDRARALCERPAWIRGIDHRIEPHAPGVRDLTRSRSAEQAVAHAGLADFDPQLACLSARWPHEQVLLRRALGLGDSVELDVAGAPAFVAGLDRLGRAAQRVLDGEVDRALAHASSGPCLQHNLVCGLAA